MDYSEIGNSISETINRASTPLTDEQRIALIGAMAVWLDKVYEDGRGHQAILELQGRDKFLESLKKKK